MAQGKQQPKFERNPPIRFMEIIVSQTTDELRFHENRPTMGVGMEFCPNDKRLGFFFQRQCDS